jgi:hypothetical protein
VVWFSRSEAQMWQLYCFVVCLLTITRTELAQLWQFYCFVVGLLTITRTELSMLERTDALKPSVGSCIAVIVSLLTITRTELFPVQKQTNKKRAQTDGQPEADKDARANN